MANISSDREPAGRAASEAAGAGAGPVRTTSFVAPVLLRTDLPREAALRYWAGPHAEIVGRSPNMVEYVQRPFSPTDHGYWPSSPTVGTAVPEGWRCDGVAEVRFASTAALLAMPLLMREVYLDEQNVFERVLGQLTHPGGGRWWTDGHHDAVGHRTVLLLRRRQGVGGRAFRAYVHHRIGPALHAAGARDLRTYTFLPWSRLVHPTPGVSHDNPAFRRYQGCAVIGTGSRTAMAELLESPQVAGIVADQHTVLTAAHAYTVERSVPVIRARRTRTRSCR
ncbi:hypothetical protein OK074_3702 [Actinobacteria bacterium OK074]|nr:hypothetical protein OK074_3702 [Actinobacteria bacterium OK074]